MKLIDPYRRALTYLRISITDRCNLKCLYCSPHNGFPKLSHKDILSYEEILRIARIGAQLGIRKIRITGGEPLTRKGVNHFIGKLHQIHGLQDISLTTNGVLLKEHIDSLIDSGLRRINISLDTLNPEKFEKITGMNFFNQVWDGILKANQSGLFPIKINTVALRHINDDELTEIARLSLIYPFHFRFIEYMPMGSSTRWISPSLYAPEIKQRLTECIGRLIPVDHQDNDGPAERYRFENAVGEVGFISAMSHDFCHSCNRLRLTSSGQIRSCLLTDYQEDIKTPLRRGASDEDLSVIFIKAARLKGIRHGLNPDAPDGVTGQMSSIGG